MFVLNIIFMFQDMLVDVANVSLYMEAYKEIGGDHEAVPFGRIKRSTVEKAKDILVQLETLVKDKGTIEQKRAYVNVYCYDMPLYIYIKTIIVYFTGATTPKPSPRDCLTQLTRSAN